MKIFIIVLLGLLISGHAKAHERKTGLEIEPSPKQQNPDRSQRVLRSDELVPGDYLSLDCNLPTNILSKVKNKHGLKPVWWGQGHHGITFMLHRNKDETNWSLFMSRDNGSLCVVSTGGEQELILEERGLYH